MFNRSHREQINSKTFANRLQAQRKYIGYQTPRSLALAMCGFSPEEKGLLDDDQQKVHKMLQNIRNWERGDNFPSKIHLLAKLCNLIDCDPDYLLYEDCDMPRKEVRNISNATGLSQAAIEVLCSIKERATGSIVVANILKTLTLLLENTDERKSESEIVPLLECLSAYVHCDPKDERILSVEADGSVVLFDNRQNFEDAPGDAASGDYLQQIVKTHLEQQVIAQLKAFWNETNGESRKAFYQRMVQDAQQRQKNPLP